MRLRPKCSLLPVSLQVASEREPAPNCGDHRTTKQSMIAHQHAHRVWPDKANWCCGSTNSNWLNLTLIVWLCVSLVPALYRSLIDLHRLNLEVVRWTSDTFATLQNDVGAIGECPDNKSDWKLYRTLKHSQTDLSLISTRRIESRRVREFCKLIKSNFEWETHPKMLTADRLNSSYSESPPQSEAVLVAWLRTLKVFRRSSRHFKSNPKFNVVNLA